MVFSSIINIYRASTFIRSIAEVYYFRSIAGITYNVLLVRHDYVLVTIVLILAGNTNGVVLDI